MTFNLQEVDLMSPDGKDDIDDVLDPANPSQASTHKNMRPVSILSFGGVTRGTDNKIDKEEDRD